jgi:hypothetical protein
VEKTGPEETEGFYAALPNWQDIPVAKDICAPIDMPTAAWHLPWDVKGFEGEGFNGTCNAALAQKYRRAYFNLLRCGELPVLRYRAPAGCAGGAPEEHD